MWCRFVFTRVLSPGIEHYMFSIRSGYFCSAFASNTISEQLRFHGLIEKARPKGGRTFPTSALTRNRTWITGTANPRSIH